MYESVILSTLIKTPIHLYFHTYECPKNKSPKFFPFLFFLNDESSLMRVRRYSFVSDAAVVGQKTMVNDTSRSIFLLHSSRGNKKETKRIS